MFTGIIEEIGTVAGFQSGDTGARLEVNCREVLRDTLPGGSIAVNGVCLTAVDLRAGCFSADLAPETLRRSNLGDLPIGSVVNLERPVTPATRLSGHIVQGHVDATVEIVALDGLGGSNWWLTVRVPEGLERYFVEKGSIALDGISLTIADLKSDLVSITVIPHTYEHTNLHARKAGDRLNVECDVLAKHVEKLLPYLTVRT